MLWLSLIPILATLIIVIITRKVVFSLFFGLLIGAFIKVPSPINGFIEIGKYLTNSIGQEENAYTLLFLILFGSIAELIQMAGGVAGFGQIVGNRINKERQVLFSAWLLSAVTFFNNAFHIISVGTILEPLIEKVSGSKEKLAFVIAITTGHILVLIPIATSYVGYMVTLVGLNLQQENIDATPYHVFLKSLPWNLFSLIMLGIALAVTIWGLNYGKIRLGKSKIEKEFTEVHKRREQMIEELSEEYPHKTVNLLVPILALLISTLLLFWWTGKGDGNTIIEAFAAADFSSSILTGTLIALVITVIFLKLQKIQLAEIQSHLTVGAQSVFGSLAILVLGWSLSSITKDLGFLELINSGFSGSFPFWSIPAISFLTAAATSYAIGSSWATWALIMPIALSLGTTGGLPPHIVIGAVWAGGSVGDTASPMGDIPVLVSQTIGINPTKFIESALPFTLIGVLLAATGYVITGFFY